MLVDRTPLIRNDPHWAPSLMPLCYDDVNRAGHAVHAAGPVIHRDWDQSAAGLISAVSTAPDSTPHCLRIFV